MRESTSKWLEPMLLEADLREVDVQPLMQQAVMPAPEAASAAVTWLASLAPVGARSGAIDWVRFGELLRAELGWEDYPALPEESS